jgi:hypothetical protein
LKFDAALSRYRVMAYLVICVLGFTAPWNHWLQLDGRQTTWLTFAAWPVRNGWIGFNAATISVMIAGIVCATAGAWLRVLGAAGRGGVASSVGLWLHTGALAILMPPSGAILAVVAVAVLEWVLRSHSSVAASPVRLHWGQALVAEIYVVGVAVSFAAFGWRYNALLLTKCVVVCFGMSLIMRALVPMRLAQ